MKRIILVLLVVLIAVPSLAGEIDSTRKTVIAVSTGATNVLMRNATDENIGSRWGKSALIGTSIIAMFAATDTGDRQYIQDFGSVVAGIAVSELFNTAIYITSDGKTLSFGFRF